MTEKLIYLDNIFDSGFLNRQKYTISSEAYLPLFLALLI